MTISLTLGNTGFPFRNRLVADGEPVRDLALREALGLPPRGDEAADLALIHAHNLLSRSLYGRSGLLSTYASQGADSAERRAALFAPARGNQSIVNLRREPKTGIIKEMDFCLRRAAHLARTGENPHGETAPRAG